MARNLPYGYDWQEFGTYGVLDCSEPVLQVVPKGVEPPVVSERRRVASFVLPCPPSRIREVARLDQQSRSGGADSRKAMRQLARLFMEAAA